MRDETEVGADVRVVVDDVASTAPAPAGAPGPGGHELDRSTRW